MTNKKGQVIKSWGNHIIQPWAESGHHGAWASLHILCHSWSAKEATARLGGSRGGLACLLRKVLSPRQLVPQLQTNPVQAWPSSGLTLSPHGPWCRGSSTSSLGSGFCWAPCDKLSDQVRPAPCLQPPRSRGETASGRHLLWNLASPAIPVRMGSFPSRCHQKTHPYIRFKGREKYLSFLKKLQNIPQNNWN